jgi:hypothetical protein
MVRALAIVLALTGVAAAQPAGTGGIGDSLQHIIGGDVVLVLPTGDYGKAFDFAGGILGRLEYALRPQLFITGRLGYVYNHATNLPAGLSERAYMIPILAGVRYNVKPGTNDGWFLHGELGANDIHVSVTGGGVTGSNSEADFCLNLGGGYQTSSVEIRGSLFYTADVGGSDASTNSTNFIGVMATVGFNFKLL